MRKPAGERRLEIIEAVLRLAIQVGPDRLTTQAVADAVGVTQPAIFRHFPTRDALWLGVAEEIAIRMRARWAEALASPSAIDPLADLRLLVLAQMGVVAGEPSILAIVFSHELRVANPALATVFRGLMAELTGQLGRLFGALGPRLVVPPADAALLVLGLLQGLALRWSLAGRGFDLVGEGARLFDLQLAGLLRPASSLPGDLP
jgi:AcrR family transcriptional regulator